MASKFLSLKNSKFFSGLKILRPECLPLLLPMLKVNFSEYGHVAYQVTGNETYNNMLLNSLPLLLPLTLGWVQRAIFVFLKVSILHIKLTEMKHELTEMKHLHTLHRWVGSKRQNFFF